LVKTASSLSVKSTSVTGSKDLTQEVTLWCKAPLDTYFSVSTFSLTQSAVITAKPDGSYVDKFSLTTGQSADTSTVLFANALTYLFNGDLSAAFTCAFKSYSGTVVTIDSNAVSAKGSGAKGL